MDKLSDMWIVRILFIAFYILFYIKFATVWWMYLLLPIHFFMGPIQGAVVNWVGHKYGYTNYDNDDHSKNSLPVDIFLLGELMIRLVPSLGGKSDGLVEYPETITRDLLPQMWPRNLEQRY